jgi:aminopeptidase N
MEYPMMVNDMSFGDPSYVIKLTSHEISHSYFPFMMGINETKYAWMDEGWACFFDYFISSEIDSPENASIYYLEKYKRDAALDFNVPMIAISAYLKRPVYHYNSYAKPAVFLFILKDVLGENLFKKVLHDYIKVWQGKHPTPYDFFYTLNSAAGQNLNWLFQPWFFEFGYADLAIENVSRHGNEYQVVIKKKGHYPVPVYLNATYSDGSKSVFNKKVLVWKDGTNTCTIELPANKSLTSLHLYHYLIPDANTTDNQWHMSGN